MDNIPKFETLEEAEKEQARLTLRARILEGRLAYATPGSEKRTAIIRQLQATQQALAEVASLCGQLRIEQAYGQKKSRPGATNT